MTAHTLPIQTRPDLILNNPPPFGSGSGRGPGRGAVDAATLAELLRCLRDIDHSCRDAAEKMGKLYMFADGNQAAALTRRLHLPMRNASQHERDLAALLDELQVLAHGPNRRR